MVLGFCVEGVGDIAVFLAKPRPNFGGGSEIVILYGFCPIETLEQSLFFKSMSCIPRCDLFAHGWSCSGCPVLVWLRFVAVYNFQALVHLEGGSGLRHSNAIVGWSQLCE